MPSASASSELDTFQAFPRYTGPAQPGFIIDFLGTRTRSAFIRPLAHLTGVVEGYPVPGNFHATALEWAGALRAVLDAGDEFVAAELGAGWGPWLVATAVAARMRGIRRSRFLGIEGCRGHCGYMRTHFLDNGQNPDDHLLIHGVVGPEDGWAEFEVAEDPAAVYGATPQFRRQGKTGVGHWPRPVQRLRRWRDWFSARPTAEVNAGLGGGDVPKHERVRCYALDTLLAGFERLDLVHVDIQGGESRLIPAARQILKQKVCRLVIGTHSRQIEADLVGELSGRGWTLEADESCMFEQHGEAAVLYRDGCQVWRNLDCVPHSRAAA
jgi:hypothetical protein